MRNSCIFILFNLIRVTNFFLASVDGEVINPFQDSVGISYILSHWRRSLNVKLIFFLVGVDFANLGPLF